MSLCRLLLLLAALLAAAAPCRAARKAKTRPARPGPALKTYHLPHYILHTDLDTDTVREAAARMTAMALEYQRRTKGFAGKIRKPLPFYLFSNPIDYYAAGGVRGSAGLYNRKSLMAMAPKRAGEKVWHVVQHEGFHQFVHKVIEGRIPVWVNEGLAEYFGQGIWTGDNYVTGVIPPERLRRLKAFIEAGRLLPFDQMLAMSYKRWRASLGGRNYDQAWSMCHFLVHADGGKYTKAFEALIRDIARGVPYRNAFAKHFGRDAAAFENRYKQWWMALPPDPTAGRYTLATVQTLTSFLARAHGQGQKFKDAEAFFQAAEAGKLKAHKKQWLPPKLLQDAMKKARKLETWSLEGTGQPRLVLTQAEEHTFTGTFKVKDGLASDVQVGLEKTRRKLKPETKPATKPETKPATTAPVAASEGSR